MMMRRHSIAIAVIAALLVGGGFWLWPFLRGVWPAFGPLAPSPSLAPGGEGPLTPAGGWRASLLTDAVPGARDMAADPFGNVWVSQTSAGTVSLVTLTGDGAPRADVILRDLKRPHGLAFDPKFPTMLYIATETEILRVPTYSDGGPEHVADLPAGGRHFTRSLVFGADDRLYVSIGSTCDVCREVNPEHGAIISMKRDGSTRTVVARGLRNAVFMATSPSAPGNIWMTEMGRDFLGDDLPPDEVNVFVTPQQEPADYGWPICYGNQVHDTQFDKNQYFRDPCAETRIPAIVLPAHVAPLGLAFLGDDLLVAYHGSWNSSVPVGYKVVRWHWDGANWSSSDFLTGFLRGNSTIGRPVDVLPMPDGSVLVSDDKSGSIWRVVRTR